MSGVFVPFVVFVATVTWISWFVCARSGYVPVEWFAAEGDFLFSFLFAITVLVIACPCALGLATPTAVMVGTGLGAKYGILIKGGKLLVSAYGSGYRSECLSFELQSPILNFVSCLLFKKNMCKN